MAVQSGEEPGEGGRQLLDDRERAPLTDRPYFVLLWPVVQQCGVGIFSYLEGENGIVFLQFLIQLLERRRNQSLFQVIVVVNDLYRITVGE